MSSRTSVTSVPEDENRTIADPAEKPKAAVPVPKIKDAYLQTPEEQFQVTLDPQEDPKQWPIAKKWFIVMLVCSGALCGTCASSMASFAESGVSRDLHVGQEVSILGISLFVLGLGIGPLLVGPLSEVYGRNPIYLVSYLLFFAFSWPVAFAPDIGARLLIYWLDMIFITAVFLIFRFLTGFCSAAFLSVSGGSVSDVFDNASVALPMAIYTIHPFIGPALGPLLSGFINQNINWRWTFRVIIVWTFAVFALILTFMPETYAPVLLKRKAKKLRQSTGDRRYWAELDRQQQNLFHAMVLSCYVPFKLMTFDAMALLLNIWAALLLGIQYLTFQAFPIIFEKGHHFSVQETGMSFIGMGAGLFIGLSMQPMFIRYQRERAAVRYNGNPPPEERLILGQVGAIMIPISLYWLAFTTYPHVHWIVPILASVPFGTGILFCFTSIFTYLVTAYRPVAASAMASNTFLRTSSAAAFPLFAGQMYHRLGTVGATALLAGLTTLAAPLPFIFYRFGARLRAKSRFAA